MLLLEVNGYKLRGSSCDMFVFASDLSKGVRPSLEANIEASS